jgi:Domain of unknown function (DUF4258)
MFRRGISEENVRHVLAQGEEIEGYPEDAPYPSRLVLGWRGSRPIHVVAAEDVEGERPFVITVYEPSLDHWEPDFKRRRNS